MNLLYIREARGTVDETARRLEEAVTRHGFGIINVVDLSAKLRDKGLNFEPECRIYEVCNPHHAETVLVRHMAVSTALPCRISVYDEEGKVKVATLLPTETLRMFEVDGLGEVARSVEEAIRAMIDDAAGSDPAA